MQQDDWSACPLFPNSDQLLLVKSRPLMPAAECASLAAALAAGYEIARQSAVDRQRAQRLVAMLEMTVRWNQTQETEQLLQTMVETSTQLLDAERATIFLLDPNSATLIGRPALGVEGGELRISEGTGVVGKVVQTGQPRRVDTD
ncbi:MAG: hypothetical protein GY883_10490, partial [Shimia sp.]|nr:hypothetical protein [Shimia sp.]